MARPRRRSRTATTARSRPSCGPTCTSPRSSRSTSRSWSTATSAPSSRSTATRPRSWTRANDARDLVVGLDRRRRGGPVGPALPHLPGRRSAPPAPDPGPRRGRAARLPDRAAQPRVDRRRARRASSSTTADRPAPVGHRHRRRRQLPAGQRRRTAIPPAIAALLEVARILRAELSNASILGRFGPDEFLVIAPPECAHDLEPADRADAGRAGRRRASSSARPSGCRCPVSAGICYAPVDGDAATELLSVATVHAARGQGQRRRRDPGRRDHRRRSGHARRVELRRPARASSSPSTRRTATRSATPRTSPATPSSSPTASASRARPAGRSSIAGLLHDVGKIGDPGQRSCASPAALTAEEYAIVKQHVALGDSIVRDVPEPRDASAAGVRHHHERWDGDRLPRRAGRRGHPADRPDRGRGRRVSAR